MALPITGKSNPNPTTRPLRKSVDKQLATYSRIVHGAYSNKGFFYTLPAMLTVPEFVDKWSTSGAAESSNAQSFTNDLCELLGVPKPDPTVPDNSQNTYVFEKSVPTAKGNVKKIDCYKRGHFILENKQGATLGDKKMLLAQ